MIPFSIQGTYDLDAATAKFVKQHLDHKFQNAVHYAVNLTGVVDGAPLASVSIVSGEPSLVLTPVVTPLPKGPGDPVPDADLCTGISASTLHGSIISSC